jgi:hypothetical protein
VLPPPGAAFALPRPDALSPLLNRPVFAAHNTWRCGHPLAGVGPRSLEGMAG